MIEDLLTYDPLTGICTWKVTRGRAIKGEIAGYVCKRGRAKLSIMGHQYYVHRVAFKIMTGNWPKLDIDHVNGNPSDNRWVNLREATDTQNQANAKKRKDNTTGLKGVAFHKATKKWRAQISHNGKDKWLGHRDCPAAAHFLYIIAADKQSGEFARAA